MEVMSKELRGEGKFVKMALDCMLLLLFAQNFTEFLEIFGCDLLLLGKVDEQGLYRTGKETVEKTCAFHLNAILLGHERPVEVEVLVLIRGQSTFFNEARQKRFDGVLVPLLGGEKLDDIKGGQGRFLPEDLHDFPFGFGDGRTVFHVCSVCNGDTTTRVVTIRQSSF